MATLVSDDMKDLSVSPLDFSSVGRNESGGALLPEDVAWADSCLIKDLSISDNGLDSLKYSLPETFPSQTIFSAALRNDSPQESLVYPTIEETRISGILDDTVDDVSPTNEPEGNAIRHEIDNDGSNSFSSRINIENVFLPTYREERRLVEASDSEADSEFPTFVDEETLAEDIFKVWELDIPDEEDELVQQLNKALAGSTLESPSASKNLGVLLDDLVSGLADLSLSPRVTELCSSPNSG